MVNNKTAKKGFTLTELLVVLAIIMLLAGLGIPLMLNALRDPRNTARSSALEGVRGKLSSFVAQSGDTQPTLSCSNSVCTMTAVSGESVTYTDTQSYLFKTATVTVSGTGVGTCASISTYGGKDVYFAYNTTTGMIYFCPEGNTNAVKLPYNN